MKSTAFPVLIFTKLTNAEQRYIHYSCAEFHPNRAINVKNADNIQLLPTSLPSVFKKLEITQQIIVEISCINFVQIERSM
jgi:hypothetical protein